MLCKLSDLKPKLGTIMAGPDVLDSLDYIGRWRVMLQDNATKLVICGDPFFTKRCKLRGIKVDDLAIT